MSITLDNVILVSKVKLSGLWDLLICFLILGSYMIELAFEVNIKVVDNCFGFLKR